MKITRRHVPEAAAKKLVAEGVPPFLASIYAARGVTDVAEVQAGLEHVLPHTGMKNVGEMANILADAIVRGDRLLVIADYDCDGATACSVMMQGLQVLGANVGFLVPDRMVHGYGLTPSIVDEAAKLEERPRYIITVDNGISSVDGVAAANALGIDVLVTDHHLPGKVLPAARCIVNPNQDGCSFESKPIAGVGVAFYVVWALTEELTDRGLEPLEPDFRIEHLLPYVALGTVADVVGLDRNNRALVATGLELIRAGQCPVGIGALARAAGRDPKKLSTADIGFGIGPRINAAGRLQNMTTGIQCLTSPELYRATELAAQLDGINDERRALQENMISEAVKLIVERADVDAWSIAVYGANWHEGVVGIVAGRVKETLYRPTFVLTQAQDGNVKGSGRSIPGFHLKHALDLIAVRHPGLLLKYGGHAMAAGLTLRADGVETFQEALETVCREQLTEDLLDQVLATDGELRPQDLCVDNAHLLRTLVWGQGFPEPVFTGEFDVQDARPMGKDRAHLKLTLQVGPNHRVNAVKFFHKGATPARVRIAYKLAVNDWGGKESLQLVIDHLEVLEELRLAA
ncbi:single-stranded-DNA-specific exonuclease RecJ [Ramlibacter alkalitolerans]|uniref:Single-stranded-DNA-specific exonuclease RecJ n=1 Tax=Ramlibacter alkalitolerans TaxID=2039631 RepID=A0ABS1JUA9_9BURK|nr:single-stranded-DNA-specific exonuclease RecJ [Ramlibacter alkalitolerans]MBL0427814.1 single-stranded-DNA-specific exonuclease RecJ [Ramlibacter alkalitolerans]